MDNEELLNLLYRSDNEDKPTDFVHFLNEFRDFLKERLENIILFEELDDIQIRGLEDILKDQVDWAFLDILI